MNVRNVESAYLLATTRFKTWKELFERQWNEPNVEMMTILAAKQMKSLPPEIQKMIEERHPEEWKKIVELSKKGQPNDNSNLYPRFMGEQPEV